MPEAQCINVDATLVTESVSCPSQTTVGEHGRGHRRINLGRDGGRRIILLRVLPVSLWKGFLTFLDLEYKVWLVVLAPPPHERMIAHAALEENATTDTLVTDV